MGVLFRAPLNNGDISLAYRCVRNQGSVLKAGLSLVRNANAECGHTCKPRRARPETHIYGVAYMDVGQGREQERKLCASCEGPGHSLRSTPCSCTLQVSQRYTNIIQGRPSLIQNIIKNAFQLS